MNEYPSLQWSTLLRALEQYESTPMNQDRQVAYEHFTSVASNFGLTNSFDIAAMHFIYALHGKNSRYITPEEIKTVSQQIEETIPTNPSALHLRDPIEAKKTQWLMNVTGTKNVIAMGFELAKYADGTHPLSINSSVEHLSQMILKSHLTIKGATVLDAFAGIGWMDGCATSALWGKKSHPCR